MKEVKSIDWSYPTSTNARKFKRSDTGCWTVSLYRYGGGLPKALAGFETKEQAIEFANTLPQDWCPIFLRYNNPGNLTIKKSTWKHKHYNMTAQLVEYCNNGSWKVILTDHTAPSAKLRRPKKYTITKFEQNQWEKTT